jgi:integrase
MTLTGCRISEVTHLSWYEHLTQDEKDDVRENKSWVLASLEEIFISSKEKKRTIPVSAEVTEIFEAIRRRQKNNGLLERTRFLFPSRRGEDPESPIVYQSVWRFGKMINDD